jgi:A/G-specific adenine glycosylase
MSTPSLQKISLSAGSQDRHAFTDALLKWNREENDRNMPWKGEKNPYRIWLSEIILQQTRVEQGLKYYEKFISIFPDIHALAAAPDEKVFKLWEGLGYYSRCRNLIHSAKFIADHLNGKFPDNFQSILELKGIGNYTAAAIASFAYNLPHAVLDGNVYRVLSRIFDIDTPIDSVYGKKEFAALANELLPANHAGEYNQAIMDFGAVVCKPAPVCSSCFYQMSCPAFLKSKQDLLPVKQKKATIRKRWLYYYATVYSDAILIRQRKTNDIWQQLFEFPLVETPSPLLADRQLQFYRDQYGITNYEVIEHIENQQKLTHQHLSFGLYYIILKNKIDVPGFEWVPISRLDQFAFPKTLQLFLSRLK